MRTLPEWETARHVTSAVCPISTPCHRYGRHFQRERLQKRMQEQHKRARKRHKRKQAREAHTDMPRAQTGPDAQHPSEASGSAPVQLEAKSERRFETSTAPVMLSATTTVPSPLPKTSLWRRSPLTVLEGQKDTHAMRLDEARKEEDEEEEGG